MALAAEPREDGRPRIAGRETGQERDAGGSPLEEAIDEGEGARVRGLHAVDDQVDPARARERPEDAQKRVERARAADRGAARTSPREDRELHRRKREVAAEIRVGHRLGEEGRERVDRRVEHVVGDVLALAATTGEDEAAPPSREVAGMTQHRALPPRRLLDDHRFEAAVGHAFEPRREPPRQRIGLVKRAKAIAWGRRLATLAARAQRGEGRAGVGSLVVVFADEVVAELHEVRRDRRRSRRDGREGRTTADPRPPSATGEERARKLEEKDAERVHVRRGRRGVAPELLGSGVGRRPAPRPSVAEGVVTADGGEDAEVAQLQRAARVDHDVARLEVAVHDAVAMKEGEGHEALTGDVDDERRGGVARRRGREAGLDHAAQIPAFDELHREESAELVGPEIVEPDEVSMAERRDRPKLALQPQEAPRRRRHHALQRDPPPQGAVVGEPHRRRGPLPELAQQPIAGLRAAFRRSDAVVRRAHGLLYRFYRPRSIAGLSAGPGHGGSGGRPMASRTGPNDRRWSGHAPRRRSASLCERTG